MSVVRITENFLVSHLSWPAQVAKVVEMWVLSAKGARSQGFDPGPALKLTGGPER